MAERKALYALQRQADAGALAPLTHEQVVNLVIGTYRDALRRETPDDQIPPALVAEATLKAPTDPAELIAALVAAVGAMERSPIVEVMGAAFVGQKNRIDRWKHSGAPSAVDLAQASVAQLRKNFDL